MTVDGVRAVMLTLPGENYVYGTFQPRLIFGRPLSVVERRRRDQLDNKVGCCCCPLFARKKYTVQ